MNFSKAFSNRLIPYFNTNKKGNGEVTATIDEGKCDQQSFDLPSTDTTKASVVINIGENINTSAFIVEKEHGDSVEKWSINNCKNLDTAFEYLMSPNVKEQLLNTTTVFSIRFKINENFTDLTSHQVHEISKAFINKSIVVFFEAPNDEHFMIYWKSSDSQQLLSLDPYKDEFTIHEKELCEFTEKFLVDSLGVKHSGLHRDFSLRQDAHKIQIHLLADYRNYNLLLLACEKGNAAVVDNLLKKGINSELQNSKINAPTLAYKNNHFEVLKILIKANMTYPESFDIEKCPEEFTRFYETFDTLHNMIIARNSLRVHELIVDNPGYRFFYNSNNDSALKTALTNNCFDIYELLLSLNLYFGPHEDADSMIENFSNDEKVTLRDINFKYFKGSPEKHINILMANSFIAHESTDHQEKLHLLLRAFRVLNENPRIRAILMAVAASKKFRIIFDFNRDSVQLIDPTTNPYTNGIFYLNGRIYIGAKQLLNPATEHETFATLAHEMCHYAMNVTYKNLARPYKAKDKKGAQEFEKISQMCYENRELENVIDAVYEHYTDDMHHAELIVRAPHLMALMYKEPEKFEQTRENFIDLFVNYENKVVPEMMRALPDIEAGSDKIVEEKEKTILKYKKLLFLSVLMTIIVGFLGYMFYKPTYHFSDLSISKQNKIKNTIVSYKGVNVRLQDLYPLNSDIYDKLFSDHITLMFNKKILNFSDSDFLYMTYNISHNWKSLTKPLKEKVLVSDFNFQREIMNYSAVYDSHSNTFNTLSSGQIIDILDGDVLTVGTMIENRTKFFIERKFISESAIDVLADYRKLQLRFMENSQTTFMPAIENPRYQPLNLPGGIRNFNIEQTGPRTNETFEEFYNRYEKKPFEENIPVRTTETINGFSMHNSLTGWFVNRLAAQTESFTFLHKNFDRVFEDVQKNRIFVLSSQAGAGKTVAFEQLAIRIKRKFPTRWVSYIPLKDHIQLYRNYEIGDGKAMELIEKLLKLSSANEFERQFFVDSYRANEAIFLWDGFDEIAPTFTELIINVLDFVFKNSKNLQFLCTRPLYAKQLSQEFKVETHRLVAFTNDERKEFLRKFYVSENVAENKIESRIKKVMEIVEKFEYQPPNEIVPRNLNTPLMLTLIAEVQDDENTQIPVNFYTIFKQFVHKKLQIWGTKSEKSESAAVKALSVSSKYNVLEIFQKYGILSYLPVWTFIYFQTFKDADIIRKTIPNGLNTEEITAIGILFINGNYKFEFAHKTFTEFLIIEYLVDNIYSSSERINENEAQARLELFFLTFKTYGRYQTILTDFLWSFLETKDSKRNGKFGKEIADVLKKNYKNHLIGYLTEGHPKLFEIFGKFFESDLELLADMLCVDCDRTLYTEIFNPMNEVYFINPKDVAASFKKYLNPEQFEMFINGRNQKAVMMLGMFYYQNTELPKKHEILELSENFNDFWDFYDNELKPNCTNEELRQLFLSPAGSAMYMDYSEGNTEKFWSEANEFVTKTEMKTVVGNLYSYLFEIVKYLPNFNESQLLNDLMNDTESILEQNEIFDMFLTSNVFHKVIYSDTAFKILWNFLEGFSTKEQRREILLKNDNGSYFYRVTTGAYRDRYFHGSYFRDYFHYFDRKPNNVFINALLVNDQANRGLNVESFNYATKIYAEHFNDEEIKEIVLSSNDYMIRLIDHVPVESSTLYAKYLKELFKGDERRLKEFIERKIGDTNLTVLDIFRGFEKVRDGLNERAKNMKVFREVYETLKHQTG